MNLRNVCYEVIDGIVKWYKLYRIITMLRSLRPWFDPRSFTYPWSRSLFPLIRPGRTTLLVILKFLYSFRILQNLVEPYKLIIITFSSLKIRFDLDVDLSLASGGTQNAVGDKFIPFSGGYRKRATVELLCGGVL